MKNDGYLQDLFLNASARRDYEEKNLPEDLKEKVREIDNETEREHEEHERVAAQKRQEDIFKETGSIWLRHVALRFNTPDGEMPYDLLTEEKVWAIAAVNVDARIAQEARAIDLRRDERVDGVIEDRHEREQRLAAVLDKHLENNKTDMYPPAADLAFDVKLDFDSASYNDMANEPDDGHDKGGGRKM